jgi:hypothetical protein
MLRECESVSNELVLIIFFRAFELATPGTLDSLADASIKLHTPSQTRSNESSSQNPVAAEPGGSERSSPRARTAAPSSAVGLVQLPGFAETGRVLFHSQPFAPRSPGRGTPGPIGVGCAAV